MDLITTAQASKLLRLHPRSVSRLANLGVLPTAAKAPGVRGAYLFDPAEVERVAAAREKAGR